MAQDNPATRAVQIGLSLVLAGVLAMVGVQVSNQAAYDSNLAINNQSEWQEGTLTSTEVATNGDNAYVQLTSSATSGTYDSATYDVTRDQHVFYADIANPDNSSVSVSVGGSTYDLEDGRNVVELDSEQTGTYSFTLDYSRDTTSIESPQVSAYEAQVSSSSIVGLVGSLSFALLLLLVVGLGFRRYMDGM